MDRHLAEYLREHERACGAYTVVSGTLNGMHGLAMRLSLSCLVDADHTDSAAYDADEPTTISDRNRIPTRWKERLER
ncbi:MAG TPA: hypothetical protein VHG28_07265, partial [Longimicrobiaceae bacterium]|nr:hypothetical protein [Longimicrobiaceae bacterium]